MWPSNSTDDWEGASAPDPEQLAEEERRDLQAERRKGYYLSFFERDRAYGGPEEGGWYYDTETLTRVSKIFRSRASADKACRRANALLYIGAKRLRYGVGSVCYGGGAYVASVTVGPPAAHYPEERPYYC